MKKQRQIEYTHSAPAARQKPIDCLKSYYSAREEIIHNYLKEIKRTVDTSIVKQLAQKTRGWMASDIKECVNQYLKDGSFMLNPNLVHPTNTCDPYTGNWAEHLMNPYDLAKTLKEIGFEAKVLNGYYGSYVDPVKRKIGELLNILIYLLGARGIVLSQSYTVYGFQK